MLLSQQRRKRKKREGERKAHAFFPAELEPFYSDIEYIGEGEFARVFKAARIEDGKEVALPIPYLEMELCDRSREEVPKPMGVEEAASIIFYLAKGLKHAHGKGIIHRDLKLSNILFKHGKDASS